MIEAVVGAVELIEDEGAGSRLHEHAFLGEIKNLHILYIEQHRTIGIARLRLQPADNEK